MTRFLIVGGGPVGLITAILLKVRHPSMVVVVVDDSSTVEEDDKILVLSDATIHLLPEQLQNWLLLKLSKKHYCRYHLPVMDKEHVCVKEHIPRLSITRSELVFRLGQYAENEYHIQILKKQKATIGMDSGEGPKVYVDDHKIGFDVLFGADGRNSMVRSKILKSKMESTSGLIHGMYVAFSTTAADERWVPWMNAHDLSETEDTPRLLPYLLLILTARELQELKVLEKKNNPKHMLESARWPKTVQDKFLLSHRVFGFVHKNSRILSSKFVSFPLLASDTMSAYFLRRKKYVFLVGDSAVFSSHLRELDVNRGVQQAAMAIKLLEEEDAPAKYTAEVKRSLTEEDVGFTDLFNYGWLEKVCTEKNVEFVQNLQAKKGVKLTEAEVCYAMESLRDQQRLLI